MLPIPRLSMHPLWRAVFRLPQRHLSRCAPRLTLQQRLGEGGKCVRAGSIWTVWRRGYDAQYSDESAPLELPEGTKALHKIVQTWAFEGKEPVRVCLSLMALDPVLFPTMSSARGVVRKKNVLISRKPPAGGPFNWVCAKMEDVVEAGDVIAQQKMFIDGYPDLTYLRPNVHVGVLYEDDYLAIIHKPPDVPVYNIGDMRGARGALKNRSVLATLPFVLTPPRIGILDALKLPMTVHRLDQPTSGLMLVAKTEAALSYLSAAFRSRRVEKEYTAVVSSLERLDLRLMEDSSASDWHRIEHEVDDKEAITLWKAAYLCSGPQDTHLHWMTLAPLTGRRHQLRKHMSEVLKSPIIGDKYYGGRDLDVPSDALLLSATRLKVPHPVFSSSSPAPLDLKDGLSAYRSTSTDGHVWVEVRCEPPAKFLNLKKWHARWKAYDEQDIEQPLVSTTQS